MDEKVYATQVWLNETYGNYDNFDKLDLSEDSEIKGKTGWTTIYALIKALQIELGITATANSFGPTTISLFNSRWPNGISQQAEDDMSEDNVYAIIQGALWCKGYPGGGATIEPHFYSYTANGVLQLKEDAGLDSSNATISLNLMKALLSMDQFKCLEYYGGTEKIRSIQQKLNAEYEDYIGLIPCDGLYGRSMNKALIKVLQSIEGLTPTEATGNFGPTTTKLIPILPDENNPDAILLFRYCMLCNGYDVNTTSTTWNSELEAKVKEMQEFHVLPVTGKGDLNTWMSLLLSKGNPDRSAVACDTSVILDYEKALALYNAGYRYLGRYLTGTVGGTTSKAMTREEINAIFEAGLRMFAIFQEGTPSLSRYTKAEGYEEAQKAITAARELGLPEYTVIYFAIDYDVMDGEVGLVKDYFYGVNRAFNQIGYFYQIGIYGARNVCAKICNAGLASSSFISDMSTGFSGNMGYTLPSNWAFDQFCEYTFTSDASSFALDKDAYSGRYSGFDYLEEPLTTLPDVGSDYRYQRAKEFLGIFGINLEENFMYGVENEYDLGYFSMKYSLYKNLEIVDEDPRFEYSSYDVVNGELSVPIGEVLETVYGSLSTECTTEIGFQSVTMAINVLMQMQEGTIKIGMALNSDGEIEYHVIFNEILRESGPAIYSQTYSISIIVRGKNTLSASPVVEYDFSEPYYAIDWASDSVVGSAVCLFIALGIASGLAGVYGSLALSAGAAAVVMSMGTNDTLINLGSALE